MNSNYGGKLLCSHAHSSTLAQAMQLAQPTKFADSKVICTRFAEMGWNLATMVKDPDRLPSPVTEKWTLFVCNSNSNVRCISAACLAVLKVLLNRSGICYASYTTLQMCYALPVLSDPGPSPTPFSFAMDTITSSHRCVRRIQRSQRCARHFK